VGGNRPELNEYALQVGCAQLKNWSHPSSCGSQLAIRFHSALPESCINIAHFDRRPGKCQKRRHKITGRVALGGLRSMRRETAKRYVRNQMTANKPGLTLAKSSQQISRHSFMRLSFLRLGRADVAGSQTKGCVHTHPMFVAINMVFNIIQ